MDTAFFANATENAADINAIAVDLGDTTFSAFQDGIEYAVDKLNEITADLVSAGILSTGNKCACTFNGDTVSINTGIIVFANGAKIKVDTTVQLSCPSSGTYYIYALNNPITNAASVELSLELPDEGDIIELCSVTDGVLSDRRAMSKAKAVLPAEANSYYKRITPGRTDEEYSFSIDGISVITFSNIASSTVTVSMFDVETCKFYAYDKTPSAMSVLNGIGNTRTVVRFIRLENNTLTFSIGPQSYYNAASFDMYFFGGI